MTDSGDILSLTNEIIAYINEIVLIKEQGNDIHILVNVLKNLSLCLIEFKRILSYLISSLDEGSTKQLCLAYINMIDNAVNVIDEIIFKAYAKASVSKSKRDLRTLTKYYASEVIERANLLRLRIAVEILSKILT